MSTRLHSGPFFNCVFLVFLLYFTGINARIAQLVEHSTDTRKVLGSIPSARTGRNIGIFFPVRASKC